MSTETQDDFQFAYLAYERQIEREDNLYQQRVNFSIATTGSLLIFYAAVLSNSFAIPEAQFAFLMLITGVGLLSSFAFERQIDRGYRHTQAIKREFVERHQAEAEKRGLPVPSMPAEHYKSYPFSEISMFLFALWVILAFITVISVWSGIVINYEPAAHARTG